MLSVGRALALAVLVAAPASAAGRAGAVATEHPLAAAAGAEMLGAGGTVVDAAIAAAAAICVVHPSSCGVGGGGFALVHGTDGPALALDYRERAPAGLTPERLGTGSHALRSGGLAVGVPGDVAGLVALHQRRGRLPLRDVLAPAVRLAREGFVVGEAPHLLRAIERDHELLAADPGLRAVFLAPDGSLPDARFRVVQRDLAATLESIAADGGESFYRGPVAAAMVAAVQAGGGVMTAADLAAYLPRWRTPLVGRFGRWRVVSFPPPGSGGVVLEILGLLAHDDLPALGRTTPTMLHLLASAMAQGFVDRARFYGDPDHAAVPLATLLAPARLAALRANMSAIRTSAAVAGPVADGGTAHVSVVDTAGNAAAITTTINTSFGAGILVPGTGVILNNEMDDFAIAPDVPNVYGLTGSAANAPAPGRRPQSSMAPTVVLDGRRPVLVVGGSGGPTIISGVLQVILGVTVFGEEPATAVAAPRIHDQAAPEVLAVEDGVDPQVRAGLERLGHKVAVVPALGAVSAVGIDRNGHPTAAADARKDGGAVVVGPRRSLGSH